MPRGGRYLFAILICTFLKMEPPNDEDYERLFVMSGPYLYPVPSTALVDIMPSEKGLTAD